MLLIVVTTTSPAHEPYVVRVDDIEYTVTTAKDSSTFVPQEHVTMCIAAVQAADSGATVTARPE